VGPVRGPDELSSVRGESVPVALELGGVRAGPDVAPDGAERDRVGGGAGGDDPAEAVQGGRSSESDGASGGISPVQQLPVPGGLSRGVRGGNGPAAVGGAGVGLSGRKRGCRVAP